MPGKKPRDETVRVRDAEKTRAKIIAAARQEFSEKGFNGARVDKIAECAGVNKRMLYYYYDTKENLYREVLQEIMANEGPRLDSADLTDGKWLSSAFRRIGRARDWLRFLLHESLESPVEEIQALDARRETAQRRVDLFRRDQAAGFWPEDIDPEYLSIAVSGLYMIPFTVPQLVYLMTGRTEPDEEFRRRYGETLERLAELINHGVAYEKMQPEGAVKS